jgi:hypothetical protein
LRVAPRDVLLKLRHLKRSISLFRQRGWGDVQRAAVLFRDFKRRLLQVRLLLWRDLLSWRWLDLRWGRRSVVIAAGSSAI